MLKPEELIYDLFCGIGGFRLPLEQLGFKTVGSCEINDHARTVYQKNFGELPTDKDIRLVDDPASRLPNFDILTAGFPCQAFSYAGKRMGFDDDRGNLFFEVARIAKQKRPKTLLLENVRGLLSHDRGRTFTTILNTLYAMGYDVEWQVINGKYFVPQNRERVFIIGHSREKPSRKIFPLGEGNTIYVKTSQKEQGKGERLRDAYTRAIDSNYWKGWGGGRTMIFMAHTKGNIKERIQNRNESWTLDTSNNKIGIFENDRIRKLTPLECERLMGFPDNWTEGISNTQRYKCLGNAVIPAIVKLIGQKLKES